MKASLAFWGALSLTLQVRASHACAPAPPAGESVVTQREEALIVWDAAARREHFVRRALFGGSAKEFGFLVPTPTRPQLAEASEAVFSVLAEVVAPTVVVRNKLVLAPVGCTMLPFMLLRSSEKSEALPEVGVTLLEQTRVAGLDATVLEASSATALAAWLGARGFALRPALQDWLQPYLTRGWTITAFRYAGAAQAPAGSLASSALRMSFSTDTPIYPYREPEDQPSVPGRDLRLFLLADSPLEAAKLDGGAAWPALLRFSAQLAIPSALGNALPGVALPPAGWLVEFQDQAQKRPRLDLSFATTLDRLAVKRESIVTYRELPIPLPYEAPFVGGLAWWWWRRRARRRQG
jgi:hypothetical protein